MAASTVPKGLIIDLVTPVLPDGGIDRSGIENHLDRVIPFVQGVLLCGPGAGNGRGLNSYQRQEVLEAAANHIAGRTPLLVWITGNDAEETGLLVKSLDERLTDLSYGGPLFWVDTPLTYHSNRGLPQHYKALASSTDRPIILFNDPELVRMGGRPFKRSNIRTAILKEIAQYESVQGIIFCGTLERARNYQKAIRVREGFRIIDGDERQFLLHPSRHGILSAGANLAPAAWQKVTESSIDHSGDSKAYPDYLKQIWAWGSYLEALREVYDAKPAPRILAALLKQGIFDPSISENISATDKDAASRLVEMMMENHRSTGF
jgi:dihydrodipicolinate synthase/N-acetylneuraminate lyase